MKNRPRVILAMTLLYACFGVALYLSYLGSDLEIRVSQYPEYKVPTSERSVLISVKGRDYYVSEDDARLFNLVLPIGSLASVLLGVGFGTLANRWRES